MSLLVCSFLSLIPFPFRHHHISRKSENIPFWSFFKKVPNAALYTWRSYTWRSQMWRPARKRMNDRKKQIHSRNNESFHRAILGCKGGCFKFPSGVYFLQLPIYLYKCHSILPAQGNKQQRQKASHWLDWNYGAMDSSHCYNQYGWHCLQDGVKLQLVWATLQNSRGSKFTQQFRSAWWHWCVWMQIQFQIECAWEFIGADFSKGESISIKCANLVLQFRLLSTIITPTQYQKIKEDIS